MPKAAKVFLFFLVVGLAAGAWRLYQMYAPGLPQIPGLPGRQVQQREAGATPAPSVLPTEPTGPGETTLTIITSPTKRDWLSEEVDRFNQENRGRYRIEPRFLETREAMQAILHGKEKPVLWSPSVPVWAARLAEAYEERHGERIIHLTDSEGFRVYLRTPIVFLTTRDRAEFLRPLLGGANAWKNIADLGAGRKKVPWGRFRYSHPDPITANSGFLTVAMILLDYTRSSGGSLTPERAATSPGFVQHLRSIEKGLIFDQPARSGSSPLAKAFAQEPDRYDVITAYESTALSLLSENGDLAVIYPDPTIVAEQSVAVVNGAWVTPEQREGARKFLAFLGSKESLKNGVASHFRTAQTLGALSLTPELARQQGRGFRQSFTSVELPGYSAMNDAAYTWRQTIAPR